MRAVLGLAGAALISVTGAPAVRQVPIAPMAYFDQHCARCHGPNGENYGKEFAKGKSRAALESKILTMAAGPGGAPLSVQTAAPLVALHQAIAQKKPYIVWTGSNDQEVWGEAYLAKGLKATLRGKPVAVRMSGSQWRISVGKANQRAVVLVAGSAKLDLSKANFTKLN